MSLDSIWLTLAQEIEALTGLCVGEEVLQKWWLLHQKLLEANTINNLTRITSLEGFIYQHLLDSMTVACAPFEKTKPFSLLDIGSGAGFPAIPLACTFPNCQVSAIESVQKKAQFIRDMSETLSLSNLQVLADRSETLAQQSSFREQFDVVTARAVADMSILSELCLPFVKPGGLFIALKTQSALEKELVQPVITQLGGGEASLLPIHHGQLPNRCLAIIPKQAATPRTYPRKAGIPQRKPLTA